MIACSEQTRFPDDTSRIIARGGIPEDAALDGTTDYLYHSGIAQIIEERDGGDDVVKQYIWGVYIDECLQMLVYS